MVRQCLPYIYIFFNSFRITEDRTFKELYPSQVQRGEIFIHNAYEHIISEINHIQIISSDSERTEFHGIKGMPNANDEN